MRLDNSGLERGKGLFKGVTNFRNINLSTEQESNLWEFGAIGKIEDLITKLGLPKIVSDAHKWSQVPEDAKTKIRPHLESLRRKIEKQNSSRQKPGLARGADKYGAL